MKILIVGAGGQLGTELLRVPCPATVSIVGLTHDALDITDADAVKSAVAQHRPDYVVNAAAYTAVDLAETDAERAFLISRQGASCLAETAARHGTALVHVSTDYVFDGSSQTSWRESDRPRPVNIYGRSKMAAEQAIRETLARHLILRTSWVFASHCKNFVRTMLRLAIERSEIYVVEDQVGCPTPAADIACAIARILVQTGRGDAPWGTYHYAGAGPVSWYAFGLATFGIAGRRCPQPRLVPVGAHQYPTAAKRPAWSVLDCYRIQKVFDIERPSWVLGLRVVLDNCLVPRHE